MNPEKFSAAMSELDDKYIHEALFYQPNAASHRIKRRFSAVLIAAVLALLLMGAGMAAIICGDSIQSWFGCYWEAITGQSMSREQTAVIEHLSQKLNISQTVGDVTVTVDSATVGDDNFFLLLRVEGLRFSERHSYSFANVSMEVEPDPLEENGGIGSYGFQYHGLDGDGAALLLMDHSYTSSAGFEEDSSPIHVALSLENLVQNSHSSREKILAEGQWDFSFSLDRSNLPETIRLPDTEVMVMDLDKRELVPVTFSNIVLTCTGLRFQYDYADGTLSLEAHISGVLKNGVTIENGGGSGTPSEDGSSMNCSHHWQVPVNLDEVAAVRIGETDIAVPK